MIVNPLVSVVMPVKNGARFVRAALDSIIAQAYTPLEIIVVDGASTDASAEIAREYSAARVINQTDTDNGIAGGFNAGIQGAQGELIAFLSSDDLWLPGKLRAQVDFLNAHPTIDMTITHFNFFIESGLPIPRGFKADLLNSDQIGRVTETLLTRRTVFDRIGLFDPAFTRAVDVDWFARAKDAGVSMAIIEHVYLHKRIHDENLSSNAQINNRELLRIMARSVTRQRQAQNDVR